MKTITFIKPFILIVTFILIYTIAASGQEITQTTPPQYESNFPTIPTLAMFIAVPTITLIYGMETWDWGEQNQWRWAYEGFFWSKY